MGKRFSEVLSTNLPSGKIKRIKCPIIIIRFIYFVVYREQIIFCLHTISNFQLINFVEFVNGLADSMSPVLVKYAPNFNNLLFTELWKLYTIHTRNVFICYRIVWSNRLVMSVINCGKFKFTIFYWRYWLRSFSNQWCFYCFLCKNK